MSVNKLNVLTERMYTRSLFRVEGPGDEASQGACFNEKKFHCGASQVCPDAVSRQSALPSVLNQDHFRMMTSLVVGMPMCTIGIHQRQKLAYRRLCHILDTYSYHKLEFRLNVSRIP